MLPPRRGTAPRPATLPLTGEQLSAVARITAALDGVKPATALPDIRDISRDRIVLGEVLGDYLHRVVTGEQSDAVRHWPVLELLRAAGADEERAAARAAWLRTSAAPGSGAGDVWS